MSADDPLDLGHEAEATVRRLISSKEAWLKAADDRGWDSTRDWVIIRWLGFSTMFKSAPGKSSHMERQLTAQPFEVLGKMLRVLDPATYYSRERKVTGVFDDVGAPSGLEALLVGASNRLGRRVTVESIVEVKIHELETTVHGADHEILGTLSDCGHRGSLRENAASFLGEAGSDFSALSIRETLFNHSQGDRLVFRRMPGGYLEYVLPEEYGMKDDRNIY